MEKNGNYFIYVNDDAEEPDAAGNELVFWELEKRYLDDFPNKRQYSKIDEQ